jgi:hypothetical protein
MTISLGAPTSQQVTVNGTTVTEYSEDFSATPTGAAGKVLLPGSTTSDYDALLALGADPADIASFNTTDNNGGTQIGPPACSSATFDHGKGHAYGCDRTYKVGSNGAVWYLTDKTHSSASMHDPRCILTCDHLIGNKFGVSYGNGNTMEDWKPGSSYPVGSCVTNTVTLSYKGVGVSSTATQCPETFGLYGVGTTYFSTKWDGGGGGPSDGSRETHAVDAVYDGANASPTAGVFGKVWWTSCC